MGDQDNHFSSPAGSGKREFCLSVYFYALVSVSAWVPGRSLRPKKKKEKKKKEGKGRHTGDRAGVGEERRKIEEVGRME